jgi:hypothetical protein
MAALSKRDIEMIFRAETDAAQRPVKDLKNDVKQLRTTLEDLTKSSNKTDQSLHDLAATTRDLEKAQQELATARTLVTQLNSQESALERVQGRADASIKKYNELAAAVKATENPTKRQTQQLAAAERAMNANNAKLEQAKKDYTEVKTSIESIIGPVKSAGEAFREIASTQRDITQGLNNAKGAAGEFKKEIADAADAAKRLKDTDAFKAEATSAGLGKAQVDYLAQQENRVELLAQAKRELAAQDRTFREALEAQAARVGADNVQRLKEQFDAAAQAEQRLAQVNAFRALAADSVAAVSAAERISTTMTTGATSAQRLAVAIQGILDPAGRAAQTIQGIEKAIEAADAKLAGGRLSAASWGELNNSLASVQGNLVKIAGDLDRFTAQESKVNAGAAAFEAQRAKVEALRNAVVTTDTDVVKLTADLAREESTLRGLGGALDSETTKLKALGEALKVAGVSTHDIPAEIARITAAAQAASPHLDRVRQQLGGSGGRAGFLGLDPYALQNLSYQVNDIFTSLASGIPPFQVLAQQSGQIVQLFPGLVSRMAALLPILAPLAAGLYIVASAMGEVKEQAALAREAAGLIASLGETNGNSAAGIKETASLLRDMGVAAREAQEATANLVKRGLDPRALDDYAVAAKNLSDVTGTELKTATDEVAKAFTSGAEAVLTLDDKYHFLTDTQRDNLKASKDTKDEYNEVNKAFTQLYNKMQDGANAMRGPYTDATNTLKNSWRGLLETIADTGVLTSFNNLLNNTIVGFSMLLNLGKRASAIFKDYDSAYNNNKGWELEKVAAAFKSIDTNFSKAGGISGLMDSAGKDTLAQMRRGRAALEREQSFNGDAGSGSRGRQKQDETADEKARKKSAQDAKKAAREAEAERKRQLAEAEQFRKQYENEQDQLTSALSRFTIEALRGTQAPLDQQLQMAKQAVDEQFKSLEDRLQEFKTKFGADKLINGMSQSDYAAALEAQKQAITLAKQLGVYESNVNDLMASRSTRLKQIQDDQKAGVITAQQALDKTVEVTSSLQPAIDGAINSARLFIMALKPSAETQALLDKFDRIQNQAGDDGKQTIRKTQAVRGVDQNDEKLNAVFERRAKLIDAANKLYESGVYNYTEKEDLIRLAYESTNDEINKGIQAARDYLQANKDMIPPEVMTNALAQLALYEAKLKNLTEMQKAIHDTAEQAIAGGLMNMFDSLAQGIANVITGAGSLKDVFSSLGRAALSFAADFMKAIAQAIIQIYALRIAKSLVGGFHGGGVVGDLSGGQMKLSRNVGMPDLNLSAVPRYHEGTPSAGLKSNEMLAVLETGEKVQTKEQQSAEKRKLDNARKNSGGRNLKQVLAFGDDQIAQAMAGPAGDDVVITKIRRNKTRIRQELGLS